MIIKAGNITIELDKYGDAEVKINEVITKYNGYIVNNKSNQSSISNKSGTFIVKVPAVKFDELISDVNKIGKVLNQNIQANDVTEEYVDLEARLKTQKELEKRIVKLLNEKVSKLADIFEIEEKLASVREKIEKTEGRMKLLKSQSSLSTLTLNVTEPPIIIIPIQSDDGFFFELKQAFKMDFLPLQKLFLFV
ncbi:MAG: DUF4349 domain-containing protein [Ignavibacteriae bacterium]|nr:DUF4349 domain-containing protein [Ignavibacteriota bacterium]